MIHLYSALSLRSSSSDPLSYQRIITLSCALLVTALFVAACAPAEISAAPAAPPTLTDTPAPSPTIVWFPPTVTPSPQVYFSPTPTQEMRTGIGDVIIQDRFSYASLWDVAASDRGSAAIKDNQFTLAVQPGVYITSLRHDLVVNNFYAEITARPSLCRGDDSYGLLVRASAVAYYRFALHCNSMVSAERISVGTRQILQEPIASGDAPRGAPGEVRIGLWAGGNEMRLFLNGRFQFSVVESNYPSGTVGVFAHAAGDTAMAVTFTNLIVSEVAYRAPTKTPVP